MRLFSVYLIGLVYGLGIVISGMANPAKVLNFFDLAGSWDPSLIFVMGGALATTLIGYRVVFKRGAPLLAEQFSLPADTRIDASLIGGSAMFGMGWGLAGFCPGGALPALGTGRIEVATFVLALITGLLVTRLAIRLSTVGTSDASAHRA